MDWTSGQYAELNRQVFFMVLFRRPLVADKTFVWARLLRAMKTAAGTQKDNGFFRGVEERSLVAPCVPQTS